MALPHHLVQDGVEVEHGRRAVPAGAVMEYHALPEPERHLLPLAGGFDLPVGGEGGIDDPVLPVAHEALIDPILGPEGVGRVEVGVDGTRAREEAAHPRCDRGAGRTGCDLDRVDGDRVSLRRWGKSDQPSVDDVGNPRPPKEHHDRLSVHVLED